MAEQDATVSANLFLFSMYFFFSHLFPSLSSSRSPSLFSSVRPARTSLFSLLLAALFVCSCFDYQEKLFLRSDFSGRLQIRYNAPVYHHERRPLLAFLPISREGIENYYRSLLDSKEILLTNIQIGSLQESGEGQFFRSLPVSYEIHFQTPLVLESVLLGQKTVLRRLHKKLSITRYFPAAAPVADAAATGTGEAMPALMQRLHGLFLRYFENRLLQFSFVFPPAWKVTSNRGYLADEGLYHYRLPLKNTLLAKGDMRWDITITAGEREEKQEKQE